METKLFCSLEELYTGTPPSAEPLCLDRQRLPMCCQAALRARPCLPAQLLGAQISSMQGQQAAAAALWPHTCLHDRHDKALQAQLERVPGHHPAEAGGDDHGGGQARLEGWHQDHPPRQGCAAFAAAELSNSCKLQWCGWHCHQVEKAAVQLSVCSGGQSRPGAPARDLVLTIGEKAHRTFKRDGNDLLMIHRLPLVDALCDSVLEVRLNWLLSLAGMDSSCV